MAKVRLKYFKISLALSVCILLGLYYNAFIESWSRTFEDVSYSQRQEDDH